MGAVVVGGAGAGAGAGWGDVVCFANPSDNRSGGFGPCLHSTVPQLRKRFPSPTARTLGTLGRVRVRAVCAMADEVTPFDEDSLQRALATLSAAAAGDGGSKVAKGHRYRYERDAVLGKETDRLVASASSTGAPLDRADMTRLLRAIEAQCAEPSTLREDWGAKPTSLDEFLDLIFRAEGRSQRAAAAALWDSSPVSTPREASSRESGGGSSRDGHASTLSPLRVPLYARRFRKWIARRHELEELFTELDLNHDGCLEKIQVRFLLQKGAPLGYQVTDADVDRVLFYTAHQRDGCVLRDELPAIIATWVDLMKSRDARSANATCPHLLSRSCVLQ